MAPHQERVVAEKAELDGKLVKLADFIKGPQPAIISDAAWGLLIQQHSVMSMYSNILAERIALF